tara:strand:- start:25 stop:573 length:549 start_codon:yes stop_codon:yes gene_type:complete
MGISTLISTSTASNSASVAITSGIDSTYDEYMFVFTDIAAAVDEGRFEFQVNVAGQSGYNETITSTSFEAKHEETGEENVFFRISTDSDQAQGTAYQGMVTQLENTAPGACAGILQLFTPSDTTYVKHFYSRMSGEEYSSPQNYVVQYFSAGYINVTGAIDEISFKMHNGNFSGVIQMYGIS